MSVDVFGRSLIKSREVRQGPPGVGFSLTEDNDFDIKNHRLCNVASALNLTDAANLYDLEIVKKELQKDIEKLTNALLYLEKKFVEITQKFVQITQKLVLETSPKNINIADISKILI